MAKDIKGVFQIFLKVNDNHKYKYNSATSLHDIFLKDNVIQDDLKKYKAVLFSINNFELLIEKVDLFYINRNQEQDFFAVGEDEERKDEVVFFIWSSDTPAEKAILREIEHFNSCIKNIVKKSGLSSDIKLNLEIKGGEELIIFPGDNNGNCSYNNQSINTIYESIKWLKIDEVENKFERFDYMAMIVIIILSITFFLLAWIMGDWSLLMFHLGIVIPIIYEFIRKKVLSKKEIKFTFKSLINTHDNNNLENLIRNDEVEDPVLDRGDRNV
jgi:hypothetical protein